MTARNLLRDDESFPSAPARSLQFEGGVVELVGMPRSHNGPTPTTVDASPRATAYLVEHTLADLDGALLEARRLVALGRHDEARFELGQVVALAREAIGWLT